MSTPTRLPWSTASGATVVPALLVDGVPYVIIPDGVTLTDVSWTTTADSLWWAGTSGFTTKGWLALPGDDRDAPPLVIEEHARPVQRELDVAHVTVVLDDLDGEVTQLLRSRTAMPATVLTATLTAAGTTVTVENTSAFPSSYPYTIHLGGEAMEVSGKTGTAFTVTRARNGTIARVHAVAEGFPAPGVYGPATDGVSSWAAVPSLRGRRATLWLLRLTYDPVFGTTEATDPTLVYVGQVGDGIRATGDGAGWEVPLDHMVKVLGQKVRPVRVSTYGWAHSSGRVRGTSTDEIAGDGTPLAVRWNSKNYLLNSTSAAPDSGGWHRDRASFFRAFQQGIIDEGDAADLSVTLSGAGTLHIIGRNGAPSTLLVSAAWQQPEMLWWPDRETTETDVDFAGGTRVPEHCYWLTGRVFLGAADAARVPAMLGTDGLVDTPSGTYARWTLNVKDGSGYKRSRIVAVASGTPGYVDAEPIEPAGDRLLMTRAASPEIGLEVRSLYWWTALRYGLFGALDATTGAAPVVDAVHWERLVEIAVATTPLLTGPRGYLFDWKRTPLDVYLAELTLAGLVPSTYHGRLAACRVQQVAVTEPVAATITADDLAEGDLQTFTENVDGLATRFRLQLPGGDEIGVVDTGAEAESGPGAEIAVEVPAGAFGATGDVVDEAFRARVLSQATTILGPWRRPYDTLQVHLTLDYAGVELGDVVSFADWLMPQQDGTRGADALACTVLGRRVDLSAGEVTLDLLPSSPLLAGYVPEAMVASISGAVLTIDTSSAFLVGQGDYGFADERLPSGALRTDGGASSFAVGDEVRLYEFDDTAPDVSSVYTVTAVSGTSITLDGSPGAPWTTHASGAGNGKVLLTFARYADVTTSQRRNAFIADGTSLLINSSAAARRFAG